MFLSAGDNTNGQLCRGGDNQIPLPVQLPNPEKIKSLSLGSNQFLAVYDNGDVYGCGRNNSGELGLEKNISYTSAERIKGLPRIKDVVCGYNFSIFLSDIGDIYMASPKNNERIEKVNVKEKCKSIFGWYSPWLIGESGAVYSINNTQSKEAIKIYFPPGKHVKDMVSINGSTLALTQDKLLYGYGNIVGAKRFIEIPFFKEKVLKKISGKKCHFLVLTLNGEIFAWGINLNGQLGMGNKMNYDEKMTFVQIPSFSQNTIVDICAGSFSSMFLDSEGNIYSTGINDGRLILGDKEDHSSPVKSDVVHAISSIYCGGNFSIVVSNQKIAIDPYQDQETIIAPKSKGIALSAKGIKNIIFDENMDLFTFIINGDIFECNKYIADFISPNVSQMHRLDPTFSEYTINLASQETFTKDHFQKLMDIAQGDEVILSAEELFLFNELSLHLGNKELYQMVESNLPTQITMDNVVSIIKHESRFLQQINDKSIMFAVKNFYQLLENNRDQLKTLNADILWEIITNDSFVKLDEDSLLKFILELMEMNQSYSYLLETINFSNLTKDGMEMFKQNFDGTQMTSELWQKLKKQMEASSSIDIVCPQTGVHYHNQEDIQKMVNRHFGNYEALVRRFNNLEESHFF